MFGRIMNEIQSYDYLDNAKYQKIQRLLNILKETFGYDEMMADQINAHRTKDDPDKTFENQRMDSRETGRDQDVELIQSAVYGDGKAGTNIYNTALPSEGNFDRSMAAARASATMPLPSPTGNSKGVNLGKLNNVL